MAKRDNGTLGNREIWSVDLRREQAEANVPHLKEQGRNPRILKRVVSAEGVSTVGYVVTVDRR